MGALALGQAVHNKKLAVALVDITDPTRPRYAALNGDEMFYAASLPKIAILLGAFVQIERGRMEMTPATRQSLTRMIRVSSNTEATRMLNRVGKQEVIDILESERFRLYDPDVNGGLWVGKEYGRSPAYRRDPLHHLSHGAAASLGAVDVSTVARQHLQFVFKLAAQAGDADFCTWFDVADLKRVHAGARWNEYLGFP